VHYGIIMFTCGSRKMEFWHDGKPIGWNAELRTVRFDCLKTERFDGFPQTPNLILISHWLWCIIYTQSLTHYKMCILYTRLVSINPVCSLLYEWNKLPIKGSYKLHIFHCIVQAYEAAKWTVNEIMTKCQCSSWTIILTALTVINLLHTADKCWLCSVCLSAD